MVGCSTRMYREACTGPGYLPGCTQGGIYQGVYTHHVHQGGIPLYTTLYTPPYVHPMDTTLCTPHGYHPVYTPGIPYVHPVVHPMEKPLRKEASFTVDEKCVPFLNHFLS